MRCGICRYIFNLTYLHSAAIFFTNVGGDPQGYTRDRRVRLGRTTARGSPTSSREEHSAQSPPEKAPHKRRSQMSMVEDLLVEAAQPLHISLIIEQAKSRFNQVLDRESLVSALTKRVKRKDRFVRTGPNTYGLRPPKPVKEDGAAT